MATCNNISICFMMISFALMVKFGLSQDYFPEASPSSSSQPLSSHDKYLADCGSNLFPDCGDEVFTAIFYGNKIVGDNCCDKLVNDVGKECHDEMTKYILTSPQFRENETQIRERSQKVWFDCVLQDYPWIGPVGAD